jgi:hypothetical protein
MSRSNGDSRAIWTRNRPPRTTNPTTVDATSESVLGSSAESTASGIGETTDLPATETLDDASAIALLKRIVLELATFDIIDRPERELGLVSAPETERRIHALREDIDRLAPVIGRIPTDPAREGGNLATLASAILAGVMRTRDTGVDIAVAPIARESGGSIEQTVTQLRLSNVLAAQQLSLAAVPPNGFIPQQETPSFLVGV